eukprot:gnl/TRDRNA2_/TRDRNA2_159315_c2_seq2.p1 gnl/TRDRNA2_/TRDRNA2_159315_c2~~gnl/TRDRNA2_/TRDRNA2_159315_c2_seq2.p1  ORF type:complete len:111 (-),score=12.50 gnl/TRDRNA2_/TRDRNA2_159315_c2_seq2:138-470(-)
MRDGSSDVLRSCVASLMSSRHNVKGGTTSRWLRHAGKEVLMEQPHHRGATTKKAERRLQAVGCIMLAKGCLLFPQHRAATTPRSHRLESKKDSYKKIAASCRQRGDTYPL